MKLHDFLIALLQTHGQTLQRLAALLGEMELFQVLEESGEALKTPPCPIPLDAKSSKESPSAGGVFNHLEWTVNEMKLPAMLEFHLWAYPFYRAIIENKIDFEMPIDESLIESALAYAKEWSKSLPLSPEIGHLAERAALIPWLKFRTTCLKKLGHRPIALK